MNNENVMCPNWDGQNKFRKKKVLKTEDLPEFQESIDNMPLENKIYVDKMMAIAERISDAIKRQGMKRVEFADKIGKHEAEISKILSGKHNLTIRSICKIEAILDEKIISIAL